MICPLILKEPTLYSDCWLIRIPSSSSGKGFFSKKEVTRTFVLRLLHIDGYGGCRNQVKRPSLRTPVWNGCVSSFIVKIELLRMETKKLGNWLRKR